MTVVARPEALRPDNTSPDLTRLFASPVALAVAAIGAFFAFRQMQAQQKAKSRQEWIDTLRAGMASTIAFADEYRRASRGQNQAANERRTKLRQELTAARIKLELLLNPSEKDHRLLMFLIQRLALWDQYPPTSKGNAPTNDPLNGIDEARALVSHLTRCKASGWEYVLYPENNGSAQMHRDFGQPVGHAVRLSRMILKREWERVKITS